MDRNTRTAHCSTELKTVPVKKWLDENAKPDDPLVLGMDWSEMDRIERASEKLESSGCLAIKSVQC